MATPTNNELGKRLGVSHSMASRIRNGHRRPSVEVMRRMHSEFGIPFDDLIRAHSRGPEEFGRAFRRWLHDRPRAAA